MIEGMTIFTGFDGAGIGMAQAGINIVAGVEYDDDIAQVARNNGHPVITADILQTNPAQFIGIQALHASPPCPNFSVAKTGAAETAHDIALAEAVCAYITALQPQIFTLENVYAYRNSKSWQMIDSTLWGLGYWVDQAHVNAADYGVPQTRQRFIVRALRGQMVPHLPEPEPWIGWYEAIEDLIPALPESQFAPWQLERLPEELRTCLVTNQNDAPTGTADRGPRYFETSEPAGPVIATSATRTRAFLVNSAFPESNGKKHFAQYEPAYTVDTQALSRTTAFLVNGALSTSGDTKSLQIHSQDEPTGTIVSTMSSVKDTRAWLSQGRVVKMNPRALARFQSFPDSYQLPTKASLACKGIGNAVPPLMMRKIYAGLLEAIA